MRYQHTTTFIFSILSLTLSAPLEPTTLVLKWPPKQSNSGVKHSSNLASNLASNTDYGPDTPVWPGPHSSPSTPYKPSGWQPDNGKPRPAAFPAPVSTNPNQHGFQHRNPNYGGAHGSGVPPYYQGATHRNPNQYGNHHSGGHGGGHGGVPTYGGPGGPGSQIWQGPNTGPDVPYQRTGWIPPGNNGHPSHGSGGGGYQSGNNGHPSYGGGGGGTYRHGNNPGYSGPPSYGTGRRGATTNGPRYQSHSPAYGAGGNNGQSYDPGRNSRPGYLNGGSNPSGWGNNGQSSHGAGGNYGAGESGYGGGSSSRGADGGGYRGGSPSYGAGGNGYSNDSPSYGAGGGNGGSSNHPEHGAGTSHPHGGESALPVSEPTSTPYTPGENACMDTRIENVAFCSAFRKCTPKPTRCTGSIAQLETPQRTVFEEIRGKRLSDGKLNAQLESSTMSSIHAEEPGPLGVRHHTKKCDATKNARVRKMISKGAADLGPMVDSNLRRRLGEFGTSPAEQVRSLERECRRVSVTDRVKFINASGGTRIPEKYKEKCDLYGYFEQVAQKAERTTSRKVEAGEFFSTVIGKLFKAEWPSAVEFCASICRSRQRADSVTRCVVGCAETTQINCWSQCSLNACKSGCRRAYALAWRRLFPCISHCKDICTYE